MFEHTKQIFKRIAESGKGRAFAAGGVAAAGASPLLYDQAMEVGRGLYSYGRRLGSLNSMVEDTDPNSPEARHRRRVLGRALAAGSNIANSSIATSNSSVKGR